MHITVGEADERAGYSSSRPKNSVRIRAAGIGHRLVLQRNIFCLRHRLDAFHNIRMIASAMSDARSAAELYITMLRFIDAWVIGCVSHIYHKCHIRLE